MQPPIPDLGLLSLKNNEAKKIYNLATLGYFVTFPCTKKSWTKRRVGAWENQSWVLGAEE